MSPVPPRRIVLVGFMGAGKTTVGRRLAAELEWAFVDLDEEIERRSGRTIGAWFADESESAFRAFEDATGQDLLARTGVVIATGGGWAARPGRLGALDAETLSVWLRVRAEEAVRRVSAEGGGRPLLAVDDPSEEARRLLSERSSAYAAADVTVDTDGRSVEDVTSRILQILATRTPTETE